MKLESVHEPAAHSWMDELWSESHKGEKLLEKSELPEAGQGGWAQAGH